jgi:hypothetical protein
MSRGTVIPKIDPRQIALPEIDADARRWKTAKELSDYFHNDPDTIYRWLDEGIIPQLIRDPKSNAVRRLVRRAGPKLLFFHVDLLPILEHKFAQTLDR